MKKIILLCSVLLVGCNSIFNPITRTDSVQNYKTRQDVVRLVSNHQANEYVLNDVVKQVHTFEGDVHDVTKRVADDTIRKEINLVVADHVIMLEESVKLLKSNAKLQTELADSINDRSQPTYSIKNWWVILLIFVAIVALGGLPILVFGFKFIRRTTSTLAGLATATVETMEASDSIDNKRIPQSLKKDL